MRIKSEYNGDEAKENGQQGTDKKKDISSIIPDCYMDHFTLMLDIKPPVSDKINIKFKGARYQLNALKSKASKDFKKSKSLIAIFCTPPETLASMLIGITGS